MRFAREPSAGEREAIEAAVPGPLRDTIEWTGPRQLLVASGLFLHGALSRVYPVKPGDEDFLGEDGWFHAAASRVERFNEDIESWLRQVHDRCPIMLAYRAEDGDHTRFSEWHAWSVGRLPRLMSELESILTESLVARRQTSATHMARGVMALARRTRSRQ